MRPATTDEEAPIRQAMASHGVRVRAVWVRAGDVVNAWAPLRGRMFVQEGFLRAPAWRRAAILAHEAGHVRLRHVPWALGLVAVAETVLLAGRELLVPTFLRSPLSFALGTAGVMLGEVGVLAGLFALSRLQEFAADRWALRCGGIPMGAYLEHLALLHHPVARDALDRLLATHPAPALRIARCKSWAQAMPLCCLPPDRRRLGSAPGVPGEWALSLCHDGHRRQRTERTTTAQR